MTEMRVRRKMIAAVYVLGLLALDWSSIAAAAPIQQFRMTGSVEVIRQVGPLPPGIFEGAPFEAILSYDLTIPDEQSDDPQKGRYVPVPPNPDENFLLIRAGASEIRSTRLGLWVGNDVEDVQELFEAPDDTFRWLGSEFTANFDFVFSDLKFTWNDPTRQAFSSDELPTVLDPLDFPDPFIEIATLAFDPRIFQFIVHAHVDSIEVIPEPATLVNWMLAITIIVVIPPVHRFVRAGRCRTCIR